MARDFKDRFNLARLEGVSHSVSVALLLMQLYYIELFGAWYQQVVSSKFIKVSLLLNDVVKRIMVAEGLIYVDT